jgi:hypothetical protein
MAMGLNGGWAVPGESSVSFMVTMPSRNDGRIVVDERMRR